MNDRRLAMVQPGDSFAHITEHVKNFVFRKASFKPEKISQGEFINDVTQVGEGGQTFV